MRELSSLCKRVLVSDLKVLDSLIPADLNENLTTKIETKDLNP